MTSTHNPAESTTRAPNLNGVNVEVLLGARRHLADAPELGRFQWQASCEWVNGTHAQTTMHRFVGLGGEQAHRTPFVASTDHPEIFASEDKGATPVEMILTGLAGCLTAGVASVATNRGIELRSVTATLTGDMDIAGILGIDRDVRNGFSNIEVIFDIDADATQEEIEALVAQSQKRSAAFDVIANATTIKVAVS